MSKHATGPRPEAGASAPSDPAAARRPPRFLVLAVATAGGAGLLPWAPGTWGSALALPIFVLLSPLGVGLYAITWVALTCLGVWSSDAAEPVFGKKDDGRIVIDEVSGQLLALTPLLFLAGAPISVGLVTGFVAFRVLDIWKPGPVRWAERRFQGGLGVMMDDVVAGGLAAGVVAAVLLGLRAGGAW